MQKTLINASSINVYSYFEIYEAGKKITRKTPLLQIQIVGVMEEQK